MKKYFSLLIIAISIALIVPNQSNAAKLHFRMEKTTYRTGESGFVTLNVDTEAKTANAFEATITFNPELIEITRVSTDRIIINVWVQSAIIDNIGGTIIFKGISLNPAFTGNPGRLIGFDFKAKNPGKFSFGVSNFNILANDGKGTKLTTRPVPREITISGTAQNQSGVLVSSSTHPDQSRWYNKQSVSLFWKATAKDVIDFVYGFNKNAKTVLPTTSTTKATSTIQRNVADGTWYAHLRAQYRAKGWLVTQHFRVNIDTKAPEKLSLVVAPRLNESILPTMRISAKDTLSGIASYEVLANGKSLTKTKSLATYKLKSLVVGKNTIELKVLDNAGNIATTKVTVLYNPLSLPKTPAKQVTPTTPAQPVTPTPVKPKINTPILFD